MEMVTQWLGRIGVAVCSKLQRIAGRTSLLQSKALVAHKLESDMAQSNVFEPLTPVVMTDKESDRYVSELRHALINDQVRNIAITGDYGAGKSSLIRTFVEKHKELNYAWVSLATFGKDGVIDSPASSLQDEQCAAPGGAQTKHSITADVLYALGPEGYLVNVGRGSLVDTDLLASALRDGTIAGAGIDVYESEPSRPEALLGFDNLLITPHLAGWSPEATTAQLEVFMSNVTGHFSGSGAVAPV